MELRCASILLVCDNAELTANVKEALGPVVKSLIAVMDEDQARQKASRHSFDAFLLRLSKPLLDDPKGFYQWSRKQKAYAVSPWLVLGSDIEAATPAPEHVRFLGDPADGVALLQELNQLFPREAEAPQSAPSAAALAQEPLGVADLKPMLSLAVAALRAVLGENFKRGDAYARPKGDTAPLSEVACALLVRSERLSGSVAMHFPKASPLGGRILSTVTETARREYGTGSVTLQPDPEGAAHLAKLKGKQTKITLCVPFETPAGKVIVECLATAPTEDEKIAA